VCESVCVCRANIHINASALPILSAPVFFFEFFFGCLYVCRAICTSMPLPVLAAPVFRFSHVSSNNRNILMVIKSGYNNDTMIV